MVSWTCRVCCRCWRQRERTTARMLYDGAHRFDCVSNARGSTVYWITRIYCFRSLSHSGVEFFYAGGTSCLVFEGPKCKWEVNIIRGEISYLAPLGSENISAPYFKQCFFRGGVSPPQIVKHHASQSQDRNNKYFILYIEFCISNKI